MVTRLSFTHENRGQAAALDLMFFALLVSFATWMMVSGLQGEDISVEELRGRYAVDLANSFALSSRYVSDSLEVKKVTYMIGPGDLCPGDSQGVMYRLSNAINSTIGQIPLERQLGGGFLDLIADDLYLSLGLKDAGIEYAPSASIFTGCFHERLDTALKNHLTFLFGGAFEYRIESVWRPYSGSNLDEFVYSNVSYGREVVPSDTPVYVSRFFVAVPLDEEALLNLHQALSGFVNSYREIESLLSGYNNRFEELRDKAALNGSSDFAVNERATVTIMIWPRRESDR